MSKHTPKRWAVKPAEAGSPCRYVIDGKTGMAVCRVFHNEYQDATEVARLLKAAPALLEALQKIASMDYGNPYARACAETARAAIATATQDTGAAS